METTLATHNLDIVFELLNGRLAQNSASPVRMVICGGAALIALKLIVRVTSDVDIVALMNDDKTLAAPMALPEALVHAARETAEVLGLPQNWLNNGPSRDEGGLFQMGLPEGFVTRLHERKYGGCLTVYFIDRTDQIHFKLFAAVDRGGYHVDDLIALRPSTEELIQAALWAQTHDVSPGFHALLKKLLKELGYVEAAENI